MRYLSLFSGIEAATIAWGSLGWTPIAFAEIAKFPSAVLQHHYPTVPNLGDVAAIPESTLAQIRQDGVDVLIGGTPCQSFSQAGLREGLDDPRGALVFAYLRAIQRTRPTWIIWENVAGCLSTDRGRPFGTLLGALGQLGYGFAYRVLNAEFWGVPQRRRRVFVVGHIGGDWRRAAAVLFDSQSGGRRPKSRPEAGLHHPRWAEAGTGTNSISRTLKTRSGHEDPLTVASPTVLTAPPLTAKTRGHEDPMVPAVSPCLSAQPQNRHCVSKEAYVPVVAIAENQRGEVRQMPIPGALGGAGGKLGQSEPAIAYTASQDHMRASPVAGALLAHQRGVYPATTDTRDGEMVVRRLTPVEWERLQGIPDNYTLIPWRGGMAKPYPRRAAIGNSMAVPVIRWLGERIEQVSNIERNRRFPVKKSVKDDWETTPELFDGLNRRFAFQADCAATAANAHCEVFFTEEDDALSFAWSSRLDPTKGALFVNPPFSTKALWVHKFIEEAAAGFTIVVVLPSSVDTGWYQTADDAAVETWFTDGRVSFIDPLPGVTKRKGKPDVVRPAGLPVSGNIGGTSVMVFQPDARKRHKIRGYITRAGLRKPAAGQLWTDADREEVLFVTGGEHDLASDGAQIYEYARASASDLATAVLLRTGLPDRYLTLPVVAAVLA